MEHKTPAAAPEQPQLPEVTAEGIKIYPTSFLTAKSKMEPSRVPTTQMSNIQIEVIHVAIFFALTIFLFISMWKRPNVR